MGKRSGLKLFAAVDFSRLDLSWYFGTNRVAATDLSHPPELSLSLRGGGWIGYV